MHLKFPMSRRMPDPKRSRQPPGNNDAFPPARSKAKTFQTLALGQMETVMQPAVVRPTIEKQPKCTCPNDNVFFFFSPSAAL